MNNTNVKYRLKAQKRRRPIALYGHGGSAKPLLRYKQTVHTYTGANVGACYSGVK